MALGVPPWPTWSSGLPTFRSWGPWRSAETFKEDWFQGMDVWEALQMAAIMLKMYQIHRTGESGNCNRNLAYGHAAHDRHPQATSAETAGTS
jgi:hypothetical protein